MNRCQRFGCLAALIGLATTSYGQQFSFESELATIAGGETLLVPIFLSDVADPVAAVNFTVRVSAEDSSSFNLDAATASSPYESSGFVLATNPNLSRITTEGSITGSVNEFRGVLYAPEGVDPFTIGTGTQVQVATLSISTSSVAGETVEFELVSAIDNGIGLLGVSDPDGNSLVPEGQSRPGGDLMTVEVDSAETMVESFTFSGDTDGWIQLVNPTVYDAPTLNQEGGVISISANGNNDNTFGYWLRSEGITLDGLNPMEDPSQTGPLSERLGDHYLVRYWVSRTTVDIDEAPQFRVRVNSSNFSDFDAIAFNSFWGDEGLSQIPPIGSFAPVDLFFHPHPFMYTLPESERWYYVQFDLMNFLGDDPNGGYVVDQIEIFKIPHDSIETVASISSYDFESVADFEDWENYSFPGSFSEPNFSTDLGQLSINMPVGGDPSNLYGNWQNLPGTITANWTDDDSPLWVRMKTTVSADEANPFQVPSMRFRLMPTTFSSIAMKGSIDRNAHPATFNPQAGESRTFYTYLEIPKAIASSAWDLHAAFDILSFEFWTAPDDVASFMTSNEAMHIEEVEIDLVRLNTFPAK